MIIIDFLVFEILFMQNKKLILTAVLIITLGVVGYYNGTVSKNQLDKNFGIRQEGNINVASVGPSIEFDRTSHDFGLRGETEIASTEFRILNKGDKTLEVGNITTSCGCTSAKISNKSIEPNDSATLTVVFDPTVHSEPAGKFNRMVFIETNDLNNKKAVVEIWVDINEKSNK